MGAPRTGRRRVAARVRSIAGDVVRAVWGGIRRFYSGNDLTYAAAIAYSALLSLFPCLMLLLAVLGWVASPEADREAVVGFLLQYFPRQFEFLTAQLDAFRGQRVTLGVAGGALAAWTALGVFSSIATAMNYAWRVDRQPSYVTHKLVSFLMLAAAGVLTFLGLLFVSIQGMARASWFTAIVEGMPTIVWATGLAARWATTALFIVIVGLIFYFVPNTRIRFRDVWPGALLTGLLWRAALAGFSWYVRDLSRFSIHGSIAAVIVFLIWIWLWAVILMYGAEYSVAYMHLREQHRPRGPG